MKPLRFLALLCALVFPVMAADNYNIVTITVTNAPTTNGMTLVINGVTRTWTNNVAPAPSVSIGTNLTAVGSATNLHNQIVSHKPSALQSISRTDVTNIVLRSFPGQTLTVTSSGGWASIVTDTLTFTNAAMVQVPFHAFSTSIRQSWADELVRGISTNASASFNADTPALANHAGLTNEQTLTRKTLTAPYVNNPTNTGGLFTNVAVIHVTNIIADSAIVSAATISNGVLIGVVTINGTLDKLTNGTFYHSSGTNMPWVNATNANLGTARIDTLTVWSSGTITNLNAPGTGTDSQRIGAGAIASGDYSVAVGDGSEATNIYSVAIGYAALAYGESSTVLGQSAKADALGGTAIGNLSYASAIGSTALGYGAESTHSNSTAIGYSAETTATNQVRLGTSAEHVSIPGRLESASGFISSIVGSNTLYGTLELKAGAVSTLVNGNNAGIILSTNPVVELSGATTIAQIAGFAASRDGDTRLLRFTGAITNWIVNEANSVFSTDGTAANRIVTGTGGDITQTNQPAWLKVRYRGTSSRWEVLDYSR